ncbi:MAG: hypothetical protein AB1847_21320 [bacterium]
MIDINGIGWITGKKYGCVVKALSRPFPQRKSIHAQLSGEGVFSYPVKNFGRFDRVSKMTCCALGLAIYDAGIIYAEGQKQDIGLLGTNEAGALSSNIAYFKDYVESGRTLARGNLFIYTLPSSPLAEAAIHFGCQGPVIYMGFQHRAIPSLLSYAKGMLLGEKVQKVLAVKADEEEALCFFLQEGGAEPPGKGFGFDTIEAIAGQASNIDQIIEGAQKAPLKIQKAPLKKKETR